MPHSTVQSAPHHPAPRYPAPRYPAPRYPAPHYAALASQLIRAGPGYPGRMRPPTAAVLDACCVLAFVAIGRASHRHGESVAGLASTAWPFLAGLAIGWLVTRAWRRPAGIVPAGVGAWLGAVAVGMILRVVAGQGTAPAFIGVALAFLGLFLLGWRVAATIWSRPGRAVADSRPPPAPQQR